MLLMGLMTLFVMSTWAGQPAEKKKIGLATYSVKGIDRDPDKAFKEIAKIGYTDIEISNFNQQQGTVFGKKPAEFKAYLESFGLKLVSSHSSAGLDYKNEAEQLQKWEALFKAHQEMGIKYVIIPANMQWGKMDEVLAICKLMNKIGEMAQRFGITFLYHNHNMEFAKVQGSDEMVEEVLIKNTDPRYVNFQMDVYWVYQGLQNPTEWLQKYPDRFKVLHIKDYYVVGKSKKIDYESIFNQFYKNGYEDFFVEMESETTMEAADEQAAQMLDGSFMRQMAQRMAQGGAQAGQGRGQGAPQAGQGRPQGGGQRPQGGPGAGMGGQRPQGGGQMGGGPRGGFGGGQGGFGAPQTDQLATSLKGIKASYSYLNKAKFVK